MNQFTFEAYAGIWFFTDNTAFLGSQVRSQEPLLTFQLHASYTFKGGIWVALSTRQSLGGEVTVEDRDRLDPETNNRMGLSFSAPLGSSYILKLFATTGVTASVGNDYDTFGMGFQDVF